MRKQNQPKWQKLHGEFESIPLAEVKYDEETGLYYIRNDQTGEIIAASYDEIDLDFYKTHPDYNPNPLATKSMNLEDFVQSGPSEDLQEEY